MSWYSMQALWRPYLISNESIREWHFHPGVNFPASWLQEYVKPIWTNKPLRASNDEKLIRDKGLSAPLNVIVWLILHGVFTSFCEIFCSSCQWFSISGKLPRKRMIFASMSFQSCGWWVVCEFLFRWNVSQLSHATWYFWIMHAPYHPWISTRCQKNKSQRGFL